MQTLRSWRQKVSAFYNQIVFLLKYLRGLALFIWRRSFPHLKKFHINAFPSTRLKDFNAIDIALKFSSEFVLLMMAGVVAFWNFHYFSGQPQYTDQSYAAKMIVKNPELNQKLYTKMAVINTVVLSQNSLVPAAQAEESVSLTPEALYSQEDPSQDLIFNNDQIVQPNPDSVQQLLAKQVKVYQTKDGDTLKSIAKDNGISVSTIIWANKLTSTSIKPGWFLIILPTDGILVKATANDTLPDIANKYNPEKYNPSAQVRESAADNLLQKIISYNGLESAEDISPDSLIIVPGGVIPSPPAPKPTPRGRNDGKVKPGNEPIPDLGNGTGHIFPKGYCTWYVASKIHVSWGGNAKAWLNNARAAGKTIVNQAVPGAIVVTTDSPRYGHVGIVENVTEDGFTVSEMNYEKFGKVDYRFIPHGSRTIRGFIIP